MKIFYSFLLLIFSFQAKGQYSFNFFIGGTKAINHLESNINSLSLENITLNQKRAKSTNQGLDFISNGINSQFGMSVFYQKQKHHFALELSGNRFVYIYSIRQDFQPNPNDSISSKTSTTSQGTSSFARLNFQYGYAIFQSKRKKIEIIPTIALGFMHSNNFTSNSGTSVFNGDTAAKVYKNEHSKFSPVITIGLSTKIYINSRFDFLFNIGYCQGFSELYRVSYYKNYKNNQKLLFDVYNKTQFYNANFSLVYKLKKEEKEKRTPFPKGKWYMGFLYGRAISINKISSNINEIKNAEIKLSPINNFKYQAGFLIGYQLSKNYFSLEFSKSLLEVGYVLNSNYKNTKSTYSDNRNFTKVKKIAFVYGLSVFESKNKNLNIIPNFGLGVMPFFDGQNAVSYSINDTKEVLPIASRYKLKQINTSLVFGLSIKQKLSNRFDLQGNLTYTHGFAEQYRFFYQKSYGNDGILYFDVYNKARFYNFNFALLYKIKKEKSSQKSNENPFDLEK